MKRITPFAIAGLLALVPAAAAKEVTSAKVCGADGCQTIDHPNVAMVMSRPPGDGPRDPGPYVRISWRMDQGERVTNLFFPGSGWQLSDDMVTWTRPMEPEYLRALADAVRPWPASHLPKGVFPNPAAPAPAPTPAPDGGRTSWWWALLAAPIALAGLLLARRRGTADRRKVYGLEGAQHGRRPGAAREAR